MNEEPCTTDNAEDISQDAEKKKEWSQGTIKAHSSRTPPPESLIIIKEVYLSALIVVWLHWGAFCYVTELPNLMAMIHSHLINETVWLSSIDLTV